MQVVHEAVPRLEGLETRETAQPSRWAPGGTESHGGARTGPENVARKPLPNRGLRNRKKFFDPDLRNPKRSLLFTSPETDRCARARSGTNESKGHPAGCRAADASRIFENRTQDECAGALESARVFGPECATKRSRESILREFLS